MPKHLAHSDPRAAKERIKRANQEMKQDPLDREPVNDGAKRATVIMSRKSGHPQMRSHRRVVADLWVRLCWDSRMPHGFDAFRVFISAPGDLEADRQTCHAVISQINEETAMPAQILLVEVALRSNDHIVSNRAIVSDNVRWSSYFIQLFQDDWGPRDLFRKLLLIAVECRDDPSMPMRSVVVFLKDAPHETNAEVLAFRSELEARGDIQLFRYRDLDTLKLYLTEVANGWARDLVKAARAGAATPASAQGFGFPCN